MGTVLGEEKVYCRDIVDGSGIEDVEIAVPARNGATEL